MKTLRFFGMALMTILLSVSFTACSSDDDDNGSNSAIVGKWSWDGEEDDYFIFKSNGTGYNYWYDDDENEWTTDNFSYKLQDEVLTIVWDGDEADKDTYKCTINSNKMTWYDIDEGYVDGAFTKVN